MSTLTLRLLIVLLGIGTLASFQLPDNLPIPDSIQKNLTENPLSLNDQQRVTELSGAVAASEWLGPLAPIAISPFFGIACLCGISQFGGDYLPLNSFISENAVLQSPLMLWVFVGLTILTSAPRFTKVSKPAAQAIDQLEAYAGIITILIIRFLPMLTQNDGPTAALDQPEAMVVQMGIFSFSADILLGIAAVINIVVINAVKFFFEVMVWLIPFPFVDAALEVTNKALCAGLMAIYAWNPMFATAINLLLFAVCLVMFRWANRRVRFLRSVIGDPIWRLLSKGYGTPSKTELTVFPKHALAGFPAKTKLLLVPNEDGWRLIQPRLLMASKSVDLKRSDCQLLMKNGFLINSIEVTGRETGSLLFSGRFRNQYESLAEKLNVQQSNETMVDDLRFEVGKT